MWVRFTAHFRWKVSSAVTIAYKPDGGPMKDGRYLVTHTCAEAAGDKAVKCGRPSGLGRLR